MRKRRIATKSRNNGGADMKYLNISIIVLTLALFSAMAMADTTLSRDGDGQKIQGAALVQFAVLL